MNTAVIIATGPSLTREQIALAEHYRNLGKCTLFGMNRVFQDCDLDIAVFYNAEFVEHYWNKGLRECRAEKWTWHRAIAEKYGMRWVAGRWQRGFSTDPEFVSLGHSSGFITPGIAYHLGFRRMILLGYDMKFAPDYDGRNKIIGSQDRHYFGEYPEPLQHWPSVMVRDGIHIELIEQFEAIKYTNPDVEIINCTPGSAMTCFPMMSLFEAFND